MEANDECRALHTALIDAKAGYDKATEDSDKPALTALFRDMAALHNRHHAEIHSLLLTSGAKPYDRGSFMSTVHETVIGARAAIVGLDEHSLAAFASGEERIMERYDKAIAAAERTPAAEILRHQKGELANKVADMKRIANT